MGEPKTFDLQMQEQNAQVTLEERVVSEQLLLILWGESHMILDSSACDEETIFVLMQSQSNKMKEEGSTQRVVKSALFDTRKIVLNTL